MKKSKYEKTSEQKQEEIQKIMKQLETGVENLFRSDKYKDWLVTMSKFHTYSFHNTVLIMMQRPDATHVAGFKKWKEFGRHVRKGEKSIAILAPRLITKQNENEDGTIETQKVCVGFFPVRVFDISQTDGKELPSLVSKIQGDDYSYMLKILEKIAPGKVQYVRTGSANGTFNQVTLNITVSPDLAPNHQVKTLLHELAHSKQPEVSHEDKEVFAESVAFVVSSYYGLNTSDYSFGYVAGWAMNKEIKALKEMGDKIAKTARELIEALEAQLRREAA